MEYPELMADIPRGVEDMRGEVSLDEQRLPLAVFARPERIAREPRLRFTGNGVFLGIIGGATETRQHGDVSEPHVLGGTAISVRNDMHMLTAAGSRAGKGRSAIIPTLLTYEGSVLAIAPKGELANITAAAREKRLDQKVCVLDPFW